MISKSMGKNHCNNISVFPVSLTLLNLLRLLVSFCTGSGGLRTETLGLALLLSSDPEGTKGLSITRGCACETWVGQHGVDLGEFTA